MDIPEVRYTKSGDVQIAYQVLGHGPIDFLYAPALVSHLDIQWEWPIRAQFLRDLASFTRLIIFDKRGTGRSDRNVRVGTLEDRVDDIRAVMDAVGSQHAILFGDSEAASMTVLFAATHPERTLGLVLWGALARGLRAPDWPWAWSREEWEQNLRLEETEWGSEDAILFSLAAWATSRLTDSDYRRWFEKMRKFGSSPTTDMERFKIIMEIDIRSTLPAIHVPTLVFQANQDSIVPVEVGRYVAEQIPEAKLVEVPSTDHDFCATQTATDVVFSAVRQFIDDLQQFEVTNRVLTTVAFTDIVGSTKRASELGDATWGHLLSQFFLTARKELIHFRGQEIKRTGDGMLAIFDGPTRAIRCACAIRDKVRGLGIELRTGLHTGECVLKEGDVQGIAVHIASRLSDLATQGEVFVSGTVRDLTIGSELQFSDKGIHSLKGLAGEWRVYSVERA